MRFGTRDRRFKSSLPDHCFQADEAYPFGTPRVLNNALENHFRFTGYEHDPERGYYYADYREQSPNLGRFFSPDPVFGDPANHQSLNRYAYVLNNPTNLTDPLGLATCLGPGGIMFPCPRPTGGEPNEPSEPPPSIGPAGPGSDHLPRGPVWVGPKKTPPPPKLNQQKQQQCLNQFYDSKTGKAVDAMSVGGLLWGPSKLSNAKLWAEAIFAKSGEPFPVEAKACSMP